MYAKKSPIMKHFFFIMTILLFWSYIPAQETGVKKDTTKWNLGNKTIIIIENTGEVKKETSKKTGTKTKKKKYNIKHYSRWAGINLGFNQFLGSDYALIDNAKSFWEINFWKSRTWDFNIWEYSVPVIKPYLLLTSGLGFQFRNYSFEKNIKLIYDKNDIIPVLVGRPEFTKNKMHITYLQVPLLVEVNTSVKEKKGMYLGAGIIFGMKMTSSLTQKYSENNQKIKLKITDDFNLSKYQLSGTFRLGFNRFTLITNFDFLSPVFNNAHYNSYDFEIYNITFGFQLLGF